MCRIEENESKSVCPDTGWGGPLNEDQLRAFRSGVKSLLYEANPNEPDQFLDLIDSIKDVLPAEGEGKIESLYGKLGEFGVKMERPGGIGLKKNGINVTLTMPDGSKVYIDEMSRKKDDTGNLSLNIWFDYGGKGKFTRGWFMDERKNPDWYCFLHTENRINYATFVKVSDIRYKIFSILKPKELYDANGYANKAVSTKIPGAFIHDSPQLEHSRLLVIPLDFYMRIPSTRSLRI